MPVKQPFSHAGYGYMDHMNHNTIDNITTTKQGKPKVCVHMCDILHCDARLSDYTNYSISLMITSVAVYESNTVRCRYNVVNLHPIPQKTHPIARDMGCLLRMWPLMHVLPQSLSHHVQKHVMLDRVIARLHCITNEYMVPLWIIWPHLVIAV